MEKVKVLISVLGGIADVVEVPAGVEVEIRDFDNDNAGNELDEVIEEFTESEIFNCSTSLVEYMMKVLGMLEEEGCVDILCKESSIINLINKYNKD